MPDALTGEPWRDIAPEEARWMRPCLPGLVGPMAQGVIMPGPDGPARTGELTATRAGRTGTIGRRSRSIRRRTSLRWARRALELVPAALPRPRPPFLRRRIHGVRRLHGRKGPRPAATLLECARHGFNAAGAAEVLHVHPQTVRRRPAQLRDMFGFDIGTRRSGSR